MEKEKEYEELANRPVPDETLSEKKSGVPAVNENHSHREDVTSLLAAAARKFGLKD